MAFCAVSNEPSAREFGAEPLATMIDLLASGTVGVAQVEAGQASHVTPTRSSHCAA